MPLALGTDKLISIKKAVSVFTQEVSDEYDVWELQRDIMTELLAQRRVKVIVVSLDSKTTIREADAS